MRNELGTRCFSWLPWGDSRQSRNSRQQSHWRLWLRIQLVVVAVAESQKESPTQSLHRWTRPERTWFDWIQYRSSACSKKIHATVSAALTDKANPQLVDGIHRCAENENCSVEERNFRGPTVFTTERGSILHTQSEELPWVPAKCSFSAVFCFIAIPHLIVFRTAAVAFASPYQFAYR